MLGKVKDAMADAAETLRRAFAGLAVREAVPEPFTCLDHGARPLGAAPRLGLEPPAAALAQMPLLADAAEGKALEPLQADLREEAGWARWGAEAEVVCMAPLEPGQAAKMAAPPLPRKVRALGTVEPPTRPGVRRTAEPLVPPAIRRLNPELRPVGVEAGLEAILALAVPIQGEDIQRLPKGLWMRYSLQLVRGTGVNVRNLEVLGLFRIPRKGVANLRHDPRKSRIMVQLESAAVRAPRAPFILARRKDDGVLLSCFVEEP